ncbi:MAG: hypothetical protein IPJ39_05960 [Saprospiraceae bacterium]|nr:hypothetical protein [Saprospiraceae bacterium]
MLNKIVLFVFGWMLLVTTTVSAQQNDNNPYSRLGIGDINDNNFNHLRQMGGLGASFVDGYHINIVNPASYSFLNATAFDFGVFGKKTWLKDKENSNSFWTGNLDYISLAFPLRNPINDLYDGVKKDYKLAMSLTLMPHSVVNYDIAVNDSTSSVSPYTHNYKGSGGSYKLMWGNSIKYKNLSFGVNLGYLYGNLKYENNVYFNDDDFVYNNLYSNQYNIKGFLWNAGLMYFTTVNKKQIENNKLTPAKRISFGIHANSTTSFSTSYNVFHTLVQNLPAGTLVDTIQIKNEIAGKGKLPGEIGLGATYYKGEKFAIGVNYVATFWSSYYNEAANHSKGSLTNVSKVSLGGYIRPDYKSFDNFLKRVYYRYGIYYGTDPRIVEGKQIDTYGLTFGLGMPFVFQRKVSHINIGLNAGIRGKDTPISEKFVKISFGVTFNDDEWFLKRKYN